MAPARSRAALAEVSELLLHEPLDDASFARASVATAKVVPCDAITLVGAFAALPPMLWVARRAAHPGPRSKTHWIALPLMMRDRCYGMLSVARRETVLAPHEKAFLAGIAGRLTLALAPAEETPARAAAPWALVRARESASDVNSIVDALLH